MIQNDSQGAFVEQHARASALVSGALQRDLNTAEEQFAAARYIARRAESDEDGAELMLMLGLVEQPWEWVGGRNRARRKIERRTA